MVQNVGLTDRIVRFTAGVIVLVSAYLWLAGLWLIAAVVVGALMLLTALTGFCGFYKLLGISTRKPPRF